MCYLEQALLVILRYCGSNSFQFLDSRWHPAGSPISHHYVPASVTVGTIGADKVYVLPEAEFTTDGELIEWELMVESAGNIILAVSYNMTTLLTSSYTFRYLRVQTG